MLYEVITHRDLLEGDRLAVFEDAYQVVEEALSRLKAAEPSYNFV